MQDNTTNTELEKYYAEQKARARAIAIEAGCLTRDIANDPAGPESILGKANVQKLSDYAEMRSKGRK